MTNPDFIKIPHQLEGELFIVLEPKSKEPKKGWEWTTHKMPAPKVELWVNKMGYNYGVTYSTDLSVMDADNSERLTALHLTDPFGDTYTVKSGRTTSTGKHIYFRLKGSIPDEYKYLERKKIILTDPDTKKELGDIRTPGSNYYNVAPYSTHPISGRQYLPVNKDAEIITLTYQELFSALNDLQQLPPKPNTAQNPTHPPRNHRQTTPQGKDYIREWIDLHPLEDTLEQYGYTREGTRYRSPGSTNSAAGVILLDRGKKFFTHHTSDPFADGHTHNAFDLLLHYTYNGNMNAAIAAVRDELGVTKIKNPALLTTIKKLLGE